MTYLLFLEDLFDISVALDGNIDKLNSETVILTWRMAKMLQRRKSWAKI